MMGDQLMEQHHKFSEFVQTKQIIQYSLLFNISDVKLLVCYKYMHIFTALSFQEQNLLCLIFFLVKMSEDTFRSVLKDDLRHC